MNKQMAYKRKYGSYKKKAAPKRRMSRRAPTNKRRLTALIKRTVMRTAEPKCRNTAPGKFELFHNVFNPGALVYCINQPTCMPPVGVTDVQRIGDQINVSYFDIKMLIGQKGDRPNVTFRYYVLGVPKGSAVSYPAWFTATTNNILLDDPNQDFVKVLKKGTWRPNEAGLAATGNDEYTFVKRLRVPYRKLLKFGPTDTGTTHNDQDLYFVLMAYDAYGSAITDNIAYCDLALAMYYRDP